MAEGQSVKVAVHDEQIRSLFKLDQMREKTLNGKLSGVTEGLKDVVTKLETDRQDNLSDHKELREEGAERTEYWAKLANSKYSGKELWAYGTLVGIIMTLITFIFTLKFAS